MIKNLGEQRNIKAPVPDNLHFDVYERNNDGRRILVCETLPVTPRGSDKPIMCFDGVRFTYSTLGYLGHAYKFVRRIPLEHIEFILPEVRCA